MFKYFVFAAFCLASAAAAPGYLGGLASPALPLAAAPAISYGHALAGPSIASYGLAPRLSYASPALAHGPLAGPAISTYGLGLSHGHLGLAHGSLGLASAPLGLAHGSLGLAHAPLAAPLGLGYKSAYPALAAPGYGLAHGW
nr:cuticle protein 70, isoforms A and B [Drosophila suzukii]